MKKIILSLLVFSSLVSKAQVGIGVAATDVAPSAQLEVKSTNKGLLIPRMTTEQMNAISNPAAGLILYNTSTGKFMGYTSTSSTSTSTTENYLQQITKNNDYFGFGYINDFMFGIMKNTTGQTFTVPRTSTLNSIQVYLNNISGGQDATVTCSVYSGNLGDAYTPITLSNPIASMSEIINSTGYKQFNFLTPISLPAGNYYFNISCNNMNYRLGGKDYGDGFTDIDANGNPVNEFFYQTYNNQQSGVDYINSKQTSGSTLFFIIRLSESSSTTTTTSSWTNLSF